MMSFFWTSAPIAEERAEVRRRAVKNLYCILKFMRLNECFVEELIDKPKGRSGGGGCGGWVVLND
jgi:hypothetical protein